MSKGARLREQRRVQAPQTRRGRRRPGVPPVGGGGPSRTLLYAGVASAAALIAAILVGVSLLGSDDETAPTPSGTVSGAAATTLFQGIPQDGSFLGSPDAPVTLVEFADIQCPFCAKFATESLPELVRDYVRPGKVRLEFRGMDFLGEDSVKGLRFTLAAGEQDRLFHVLHLLYENQGAENSGWVTDDLLASIGAATPGLDVDQAFADADSDAISQAREDDAQSADENGINSTPSFLAGPTGGTLERVEVESLDADALRPTLDRLLEE